MTAPTGTTSRPAVTTTTATRPREERSGEWGGMFGMARSTEQRPQGSTARIGRVNPTTAPALRDALVAADFTYDGVAEVLGQRAHDALARNETTPGLARTRGGSPVETLARLFLLQTAGAPRRGRAGAARAGRPAGRRRAARAQRRRGRRPARLPPVRRRRRRRRADLWVVSDLTPGLDGGPQRVGADHVLGISPASTSLAQLTLREPVGSRARPRHRLRRAGAAPRPPRRPRRRHRRQRRAPCASPASTPRSTRSRSTCATARSSSRCAASGST